jgi:flagellin
MSLVINTNVSTLNSQRALTGSSDAMARAIQRLSSGLRINSARDDAAGLAISTRMTTQINGKSQAIRNANDGISMLQTAEGSLSTLVDNLQRIRELAVQSANATNSDTDRAALQAEAAQRLAEVDRIAKTAAFNGTRIFSQDTSGIAANADERAVVEALKTGWLEQAENLVRQYYGIEADGASIQIDITGFSDGAGGTLARVGSMTGGPNGRGTNVTLQVDMADFSPPNLPDGGNAPFYADRVIAHEMVHAIMARATNFTSLGSTSTWFLEGAAEFFHGADERAVADIANSAGANFNAKLQTLLNNEVGAAWGSASSDYSAAYISTRFLHQKLKDEAGGIGMRDFMQYLNGASAPTMNQALDHFFGTGAGNAAYNQADFFAEVQAEGVAFVNAHMNLGNIDTGSIGGLDADGGTARSATDVMLDVGSTYGENVLRGFAENWEAIPQGRGEVRTAMLQVGSEVGQGLELQFGAMNLEALGIGDLTLATAYGAQRAMIRIDTALDYVSGQRADLGSQLSRLDSVVGNLQVSVESGSASRSRIMDTDYASETAELTRAQILQQAGTAMVAQANAQPRNVLSLLGR